MSFNIKGEAGFISGHNFDDENGNPAGGHVQGVGFRINWQNGPVDLENDEYPSGAFIEDVIKGCIIRMQYYQNSKFACRENAIALTKLEEAGHWLEHRRKDRAERGVLGKHEK